MHIRLFVMLCLVFPYVSYSGEVPIGTIEAYLGDSTKLPDDWIVCDGRSLLISQYLGVFSVIGWKFGLGDDTQNYSTFALPDLRGQFLRGTDSGAGIDKDLRTLDPQGGRRIRNEVGTFQGSATALPKAVNFAVSENQHITGSGFLTEQAPKFTPGTGDREFKLSKHQNEDAIGSHAYCVDIDIQLKNPNQLKITEGGDPETRPVNFSVTWIIKVK